MNETRWEDEYIESDTPLLKNTVIGALNTVQVNMCSFTHLFIHNLNNDLQCS